MKLSPLFAALLLIAAACSDDQPSIGDNGISSPGFEAELGEQTVMMPEDVVEQALTDYDTEDHVYTFDVSQLDQAGIELQSGEILLIAGVALRRITNVVEQNGQVTVETDFATLPEAFENASINYSEVLRFTPEVAEKTVIEFMGKELAPTSIQEDGKIEWEYELGDWTIKGIVDPRDVEVYVGIEARVEKDMANAAYIMETTIKEMATDANINIADHETKEFGFRSTNIGGEMKLKFVGAGGVSPDVQWGPRAIFRYPFMIGPIPGVMSINTRTANRLELPNQGFAEAEVTLSYSGDTGFTYEDGSIDHIADGGIDSPNRGRTEWNAGAHVGYTADMQWGIAIPEFSFSLFGNTVVPSLRPEFYLRTSFTWPGACTRVSTAYEINAALAFRLLGVTLANPSRNIITPWEWSRSEGNCGDGKQLNPADIDLLRIADYNQQADGAEVPYVLARP